jgi:dihydropteroate synthase
LRAHKAGIERRRIVLDPGLEHGKRGHENFNLLRSLGSLAPPGQGVQVTLAGKRFLLESVRASAAQRAAALTVAATLALESGAHMLTVERPDSVRDAVAVVDRIYVGDEAQEPDG